MVTAGRIGQLPALTVPLTILGSIVFALSSLFDPWTRLTILLVGTGVFLVLGSVIA